MGFFKQLFSNSETVNKTVDAVINTGDALFFTDEEKSQASQKKLDWVLEFYRASKGSNLARRWVAVMVVGVFLFLVLQCAVAIWLGNAEIYAQLFALISGTLTDPLTVIIGFYFLAGAVTRWTESKK